MTPPDCSVDLRSTFGGRRPPLQPHGGVNPPLHNPGYRVTYLPVDREGLLNLADLEAAITDETAVVSPMWANNETGVLFPVESIAEICRSRGVLYHSDRCKRRARWRFREMLILARKNLELCQVRVVPDVIGYERCVEI